MKYALFCLLFCMTAHASPLSGTIIVELDDGTVKEYPADKYVVVKREKKKKPPIVAHHHHQPPVVVVVQPQPLPTPAPVATASPILQQPEPKKNRVRVMGGLGPNGVAVAGGPQTYTVSPSEQLVGGIGYSRVLTGPWSLDAQAITNKTFTLGLGLDF